MPSRREPSGPYDCRICGGKARATVHAVCLCLLTTAVAPTIAEEADLFAHTCNAAAIVDPSLFIYFTLLAQAVAAGERPTPKQVERLNERVFNALSETFQDTSDRDPNATGAQSDTTERGIANDQ